MISKKIYKINKNMGFKFITPVSMEITWEQYKNLSEKLKSLGYKPTDAVMYDYKVILYTCAGGADNYYSNSTSQDSKTEFDRYFIDHYNPELFLALAAMTNEDKPIKGEYFIGKDTFLPHEPRKATYDHDDHLDSKQNNAIENWGSYYRKATKEELINFFYSNLIGLSLPVTSMEKTYKIKRKDCKIFFDLTQNCSKWQHIILEHLKSASLVDDEIEIKHSVLENAYNEANDVQRKAINKYFPDFKKGQYVPFEYDDLRSLLGKVVKLIDTYILITAVGTLKDNKPGVFTHHWISTDELLERYTFENGTPCGKRI